MDSEPDGAKKQAPNEDLKDDELADKRSLNEEKADEWSLTRKTPESDVEADKTDQGSTAEGFGLSKQMTALLRNTDDETGAEEDPEKTIKLVMVGDGTCGKTSLCTRFAQRDYANRYTQTVGVDFFSRRIALPSNCNVLFQIWDVGGQSISANMLGKYIYDANCIIFVYDVTNSASFESITDWVAIVKKLTSKQDKFTNMSLIGNKTDLEHRRTVRIDKHTRFADQYGMSSHYVSAKTGDSVDLSFKLIAAEVLGIQLTKVDVELAINAIEAPVAVLEEPTKEELRNRPLPQVTPTLVTRNQEGEIDVRRDYSKQSSVCSVQ